MKAIAVNTEANRPKRSPKSRPKLGDGHAETIPNTTPSIGSLPPNRPKRDRELNDRQKAFAVAWVKLRAEGRESFSETARMSGYTGRIDTLSKTGKKLLNNAKVLDSIAQLTKEALTAPLPITMPRRFRYIMGPAEVLATTTFLARATLDDVLDEEGKFDIEKARTTRGIHALKQIQFYKDGAIKAVALRDKNASLELMGRNLCLWDDDVRSTHDRRRRQKQEASPKKWICR